MGDHRAGTPGTTVPLTSGGRRVARHAVERPVTTPYAGRRVAGGRRVAERPLVTPGRRIALSPELADDPCDVVGHLLAPTPAPVPATYVGRRIARPVVLPVVEPPPAVEVLPLAETLPLAEMLPPAEVLPVVEPLPVAEVLPAVAEPPAIAAIPVLAEPPVVAPKPRPRSTRSAGRRAAARRTRVPSLPLLAGVAVLAVSAGGALQAVHPGLGASGARLEPAGVLSGDHAVASASLLAGRGASVSRSSDRLQAAADAEARQRDAALSAFAVQAEKKSAQIQLHQWVLPITAGTFQLTARFGQYSALWSTFHTGLDFAAPTGTPIMAIAAGKITSVGFSGAFGNRTVELLPDGTELWYCHQNAFGTAVGDEVKAGQVIGYVGSTGNVTGPHLHLEVHPHGGDAVDPYPVLVDHGLYPGPPT